MRFEFLRFGRLSIGIVGKELMGKKIKHVQHKGKLSYVFFERYKRVFVHKDVQEFFFL